MLKKLVVLFAYLTLVHALKCYTGLQVFGGNGAETKDCESSSDYCYNATATGGTLLNVAKAGCSTYRCYLAQNTCIRTDLQGVPVSFCCCNSGDLCNGRD